MVRFSPTYSLSGSDDDDSIHYLALRLEEPNERVAKKVPTFGTYGFSVTLIRFAYPPPLAQRRVLARARCIYKRTGRNKRTLAKSSAATTVRTEKRDCFLQRSSLRDLGYRAGLLAA